MTGKQLSELDELDAIAKVLLGKLGSTAGDKTTAVSTTNRAVPGNRHAAAGHL